MSLLGSYVNLAGATERQKYQIRWYWARYELGAPENSVKSFLINAERSPEYSSSRPVNLEESPFPTVVGKCWLVFFSITRKRMSWMSPLECGALQGQLLTDFMSPADVQSIADRFTYSEIVRFFGNGFAAPCIGAFVLSILGLDRFQHLGRVINRQ
jgi:hypothetical protein